MARVCGTLDDKGSLVAIAEAVELLLAEGFVPARDIYLSFSSDEEALGTAAPNAVAHLKQQGVAPWFVLDEGGAVAADAFPGALATPCRGWHDREGHHHPRTHREGPRWPREHAAQDGACGPPSASHLARG